MEPFSKLFAFDKNLYKKGFKSIAGVDESGRGPLAGPLVAAAVMLPKNTRIKGLKECKQLLFKKREILYLEILEKALSYSIKVYDNNFIDAEGLQKINLKALEEVCLNLEIKPDFVLVDGYKIDTLKIANLRVIKGDQVSASIAAASIIAKVHRDHIMNAYHRQYPQYGFDSHKGYGSKQHFAALKKHGPSPIHRKSFNLQGRS